MQPLPWIGVVEHAKVATCRRDAQPFTMDWHGRAREREVKLQLLGFPQGSRATLCGDWSVRARGKVATFRVPAGFPRNPLRGLAWSSVRMRGKLATFRVLAGFPRNPSRGLAWSSVRTRGKVACYFEDSRAT